jgi:aromatic-L-amino-acid decarboxylase
MSFHMTPDEFREHGHEVVEWLAAYMESVEDYPVLAQVKPGEIRSRLPDHAPEHGEPFEAVMEDLNEIVMPGVTHWQSPNFFAYFAANTSGPSILAELITAGLGIQGMLWTTGPVATELETHVLDWLAEMLGLPSRFMSSSDGGAVIQDSASSASLVALLTARERATGFMSNESGLAPGLVAYASNQAHSSIEKAVRIAGLGSEYLRLIDVDESLAMRPEALKAAMADDQAAGLTPAFVVATVGTTSSTAMDPVRPIGEIARHHGAWFHVDAAWAGNAAICPEHRPLQDGLELADSYLVNPHKWMFTNFDCDAYYVADRDALIRTLSVLPEYLRNEASTSGAVIDYRDWQIPLGRRFRALKLWFVIRHYGVEGLRHHIREHIRLGQELAARVEEHPDFELAAPTPLNLVCFRHVGGDDVSERIVEAVNAGGRAFLTHTKISGRYVIRFNVGQTQTEEHHVEKAWNLITQTAKELA